MAYIKLLKTLCETEFCGRRATHGVYSWDGVKVGNYCTSCSTTALEHVSWYERDNPKPRKNLGESGD